MLHPGTCAQQTSYRRGVLRVAIISDLHANLEALESFPETWDELWVLGDLVNYGPNPREVIQFVRDRATVVIRGNHDNAIGLGKDPRCSPRYRDMSNAMGEVTASVMNASEKEYLAGLPLTDSRIVDGKRFVLCHATPSDPLFEYSVLVQFVLRFCADQYPNRRNVLAVPRRTVEGHGEFVAKRGHKFASADTLGRDSRN
jgi:predicted phosphodiesterase